MTLEELQKEAAKTLEQAQAEAEAAKAQQALVLAKHREIGSAIVGEAQKQYEDERRNAVIGEVKRLLACREETKALLEKYQASLDWFERKLHAIEAGEFEFSGRGQIVCNDEDLRRANY